ncbi:MAG TPA: ornithine carbamoyltransferase [Herpetosiphonaceae bacterium]|nr:ornithine carbamoyltransferase [Herpetosiphonaceae bacterium]
MTVRHYVGVADLSRQETLEVIKRAHKLRTKWRTRGKPSEKLRGYTLASIYEKPSLRTRVTFEAGMTQLGGHAIYLGPSDIQLGRREPAGDVARNLSRWVQIISARTFAHKTVEDLASASDVPVINALSDREHPCQALADFLTLYEHTGGVEGRKLAYIGDGNNVAHSLLLMGALLGTSVAVAGPADYAPDSDVVEQARALAAPSGAEITITPNIDIAVVGADAVYTDVWTSMGQEQESSIRRESLAAYQVTPAVMSATGKPDTIFLHCLPAHRGEEVTAEVIDGPQSVVLDQAENRLHAQKALILFLLGK